MFRVEYIPTIVGVLIGLAGSGLIYDATRNDAIWVLRERRRRRRTPRDRPGEALAGGGMIMLGVALVAGEFWRFSTLTMFAGFALVAVGALRNRAYLRELLLFRGPARRAKGGSDKGKPRPRIR